MDIEASEEEVKKILRGITIPSPPQIVADLQMELLDPMPNLKEVAKLISKDAGLSGCVLKTANSPFFGLPEKVNSIHEAVVTLGLKTIESIVNTHCLRSELIFEGASKEVEVIMNRAWDLASDIAQVSSIIADRCDCVSKDKAYMLGLFHNTGMILLMRRFDNYVVVLPKSYAARGQRIVDIENEHFSTNHAVVGYYVAKSWKLPEKLCLIIANHHSAEKVFLGGEPLDEEAKNLLGILKLAEHIIGYYKTVGGQNLNHEWETVGPAIMTFLGLNQDDVDDLQTIVADMGIGSAGYYF